jgi:hypothetical protein|tara:strand:- start:1149 stop:1382 length:234 start_codon:yes stop_codon:yes gene_type:complete
MAKNREASQFNSLVNVNDSSAQVGIANSVGINTTAPTGSYALDVHGTINSNTDVQINGVSITSTASGDATALAIALG